MQAIRASRHGLVFLAILTALSVTTSAHAACEAHISDLRVIDPPTQERALVEVDYSVVGGTGGVILYINGQNADSGGGNGHYSNYVGPRLACVAPGQYTYRAVLNTNCGGTDERSTTRTYDPTPTVHVTLGAISFDDLGASMPVTFAYTFPYITEQAGPHSRDFYFYVDGRQFEQNGVGPGDPWQGTKTVTVGGIGCLTSGTHAYTATAVTSCKTGVDPGGTFELGGPTVEVSGIEKAIDPSNNQLRRKAVITWDMGIAPYYTWSLRLDRMAWKTADGVPRPGGTLSLSTVTQRTGSMDVFFDVPGGGQQMTLVATAAACPGRATRDIAVDCSSCDGTSTVNPVSLNDGNVRVFDSDPLPPIAGRTLARTYDSDEQVNALFGRGWTTLFERRIIGDVIAGEHVVSLVSETNDVVTFRENGDGSYRQTWPLSRSADGTLVYDSTSNTYRFRAANSMELAVFRQTDGALAELRDLGTGRALQIAYSAGLPQTVTDSWSGTAWNLTIDNANRRVTSIGVSGRPDLVWTYNYDASGNLQSVVAPGSATWRTYEYAGNRMTASRDGAGNLIESHTYDASGYGVSSTGSSDEIASIAYNIATGNPQERITRVTEKNGHVADYLLRASGGSWRTVRVSGGCGSCGNRDVVFVRDSSGRVIRRQDPNGYITTYTFARRPQPAPPSDDGDSGVTISRPADPAERLMSSTTALKPAGCNPDTSPTRCMQDPASLATLTLESTAATVTTAYEYNDPIWPERITAMVTPSVSMAGQSRRQETTYHAASGEVIASASYAWTTGTREDADSGSAPVAMRISLTTATRLYEESAGDGDAPASGLAPAFNPGGNFASAWLSLPQPAFSRKSVDGPRNDVADITQFVYYPIDNSVSASLRGRLAAVRNAAGHITRYESYDVFGNPTRIVDPNGVATEMTYDALGRLSTSTIKGVSGCDTAKDPLCATDLTTTRTYSPAAGPLQREQSPAGGVRQFTYDGRGRVLTISRGPSASDLREQLAYSYDSLTGKKSSERLLAFENGAWVEKKSESFAYDSLAQLQTITHADATTIAYTYDAAGRVLTVRDENHASANTTYSYDPAGRVAGVTQTLSGAPGGSIASSYGYDIYGSVTSVTDPNGNVTTYAYDDFGRLLAQQSPVSGTSQYEYDEASNPKLTTDANGATTQRGYDALNRMTSSVSTKGTATESVTWSYDSATANRFSIGRLSTMSDPTGSTSYSYERRGQLREEVKTIGSGSYTTAYQYDANGNRSRIDYPSGRSVTYTFDFADRPFSAATAGTTLVSSAKYLPFGPMTEAVYGNGTTKSVQYDNRYRITRNDLTGSGDPLASYGYGYDSAGNITGLLDLTAPQFDRHFGYDDLNRLVTANSGEALWGEGGYAYDAMGNLQSLNLGGRKSASFSYSGTTPKLASVTEGESVRAVSYDPAGNETGAGGSLSTYTPRNHLATYGGATYRYDGRGLRTVTIRATQIVSLALNPATVGGGDPSQGTVTLSGPGPTGGALVALTASSSVVTIPSSVTIPAGQQSVTFAIQTQAVTEQVNVIITAAYEGSSKSATLSVDAPRLDSMSLAPSAVTGGQQSTALLSLLGAAPEGGMTVSLESSRPAASVPAQVVIPAGAHTFQVPVQTTPVAERTTVSISASAGSFSAVSSLVILPAGVESVSFSPPSLHGGSTTTGTIALSGAAPQGGSLVMLTSESDALSLPPSVAIAAGASSATFAVSVAPVESEVTARITASLGESASDAVVRVTPPLLGAFSVNPAAVVGGENANAAASLDAPAATGGASVQVTSSNSDVVPAPATLTVPGGATSGSATLPTLPVAAATPVVVSATRNGVTRSTTVTVQPPPVTLASLVIAPASLVGTNGATGTVTLTDAAPAGGVEVELTSSDPSAASVPAIVVVAPGSTSAPFSVSTSLVSAARTVTITAAHATTEKTFALSVLPPSGNYVSALSVVPSLLIAGSSATGRVTLAAAAGQGGVDVALASSDPSLVSVPSVVTVKNKDLAADFTLSAHTITSPAAVTISASFGGVIQRVRLIVAPANAVTLSSLAITPVRVIGGNSAAGVVTLTAPAPAGGAAVTIESRRRTIATVPATVTIPEGATSGAFTIATDVVHAKKDKLVEIVAGYNGVSATATLAVAPPVTAAMMTARPVAYCAGLSLPPCLTGAGTGALTELTAPVEQSYSLYSPEFNLMAETATSTSTAPAIAYEYLWFAGQPLAQVETATNTIHWYFNDHLGTPVLQTDSTQHVVWRVEYEPYGTVYAARQGEGKHQPLRFPGQENDASTDLSYNVFRWYRGGWGRYHESDPLLSRVVEFHGVAITSNPFSELFAYAGENPLRYVDSYGLYVGPVPGAIAQTCAKTKNPVVIMAGLAVALIIYAVDRTANEPAASPTYRRPRQACNACHEDDDDDDRGPCERARDACLEDPWRPSPEPGTLPATRYPRFGFRKDCGACYRECKHAGGIWPTYKCPGWNGL